MHSFLGREQRHIDLEREKEREGQREEDEGQDEDERDEVGVGRDRSIGVWLSHFATGFQAIPRESPGRRRRRFSLSSARSHRSSRRVEYGSSSPFCLNVECLAKRPVLVVESPEVVLYRIVIRIWVA